MSAAHRPTVGGRGCAPDCQGEPPHAPEPKRARPSARELGFKAAAAIVSDGGAVLQQVACWMYDPDTDEYLTVSLPGGRLIWTPAERLRIDTSCFIDGRKVAEKASGAFPGEITYQPPEEDSDA